MRKNKNFKKLMMFAIAAFMIIGVFTLTSEAAETAAESATCDYEVWLYDTYGDGWNGNYLDIYVNGIWQMTVTCAVSGPDIFPFTVNDGDVIFIDYVDAGSWEYENIYEVYDGGGVLLATIDVGTYPVYGDADWSGVAACGPPMYDCYFEEDFSSYNFNQWTVYSPGGAWSIVSGTQAGGTSPNARLYWYYSMTNGGDYIQSNPVDTSSETDLWMQFRSFIDYYSSGCSFYVEVSPNNGVDWFDVTPWVNPITGNVGPNRYLVNIPQAIGTQTTVKFTFMGYYVNFDYWYLDDIKICDFIEIKDVATLNIIQPDPYATGGWTDNLPVQNRVANNGNTPQNVPVRTVIEKMSGSGTIYFENFDSSWDSANPPAGWKIYDYGEESPPVWNNNDWYRYTSYSGCPRVYYSPYEDNQDEWLVSPSINCASDPLVELHIGYMYAYFSTSYPNIHAYIEGSTDGGANFIHPIDDWDCYSETTGSNIVYDISSWAANQPDIQIRFRFVSPGTGYRYGYWYFNDFEIYGPPTYTLCYDQTQNENLAPGEVRNVLLPNWFYPLCGVGNYRVTASVGPMVGDEDPSNDVVTAVMPIGPTDCAMLAVTNPLPQIGPVDFIPSVVVQQLTNWNNLKAPVTYSVYEQPFVTTEEIKYQEGFEGLISSDFYNVDPSTYRGIEMQQMDKDQDNQDLGTVQAHINWLGEPAMGAPGDWTIIDDNWDSVSWNPSHHTATEGTTSMWMGDPSTGKYPMNSYDWLISPGIDVGAQARVEFDLNYTGEYSYDYPVFVFSPDGWSWWGWWFAPTYTWTTWSFTIPSYGIHTDGTMYIGFIFASDSSINDIGTFVDNVKVYGTTAMHTETFEATLPGSGIYPLTFTTPVTGLQLDKSYVVQASIQHPRDNMNPNNMDNELTFYFDTFVDIWNGRTGKAFATIQDAIDDPDTLPGDTIYVADGNYYEDITIWKDITVTGVNEPSCEVGYSYLFGTVTIVGDGATFSNFYVHPLTLFTSDQAAISIFANNVEVSHNTVEIQGSTSSGKIKGIWDFGVPQYYLQNTLIYENCVHDVNNCYATGGGGDYGPWQLLDCFFLPGTYPETWYPQSFGLSAYYGKTVQFAWEYLSDDEWGCYIDDVVVGSLAEGFEGIPTGTLPPGWTQENNGIACSTYNDWGASTYKAHTGSQSAECRYNCPNDDWLISPDVTLTSGDTLDYWYLWDDSWDIYYCVWVREKIEAGGGIGGAVGILDEGAKWHDDIINNTVYNVNSNGYAFGIKVMAVDEEPVTYHYQNYLDFYEDFTGVATGALPTGWTKDPGTTNWGVYPSANAGGVSPEMRFYYSPSSTDDFYLMTPVLNTVGFTTLDFSFRHMINHYTTPYTLDVVAIADGNEYLIDSWTPTGSQSATLETYTLTTAEGVGAASFQIAFVFRGYSWNINYWYIDDVSLFGAYDYYITVYGWPVDKNIVGNWIYNINCPSTYPCPEEPLYEGVMLGIGEGADASEVRVRHNFFDPNCQIPAIAILNMDLFHCLDAANNYFGYPDGPGSYNPLTGALNDPAQMVTDCLNGNPANGGGSQIAYGFGPVHFYPFLGLKAITNLIPISADTNEIIPFDGSASWAKDFTGVFTPVEFFWKFGDGHYSFEPTIGHAYTAPGTYDGYLRVHMFGIPEFGIPAIYDWAYFTITVTAPGAPLSANAGGGSLSHYEVTMGYPLELSGSASGGTPPYTYSWDLGDGRTINEQSPTVVYTLEDKEEVTYTVTLTVVDANYDVSTDTVTVTVLAPEDLHVSISAPANAQAGQSISLISTVTGGKQPFTYEWNFDDGTTSNLQKPTHIYETAGTYEVTLTVTDSLGAIDTATKTIEITAEESNPAEIKQVKGGLSVKATIAAGDSDCGWTINVDGKYVFSGGEASGTIPAGTEQTVQLPFTFALGKVTVTVTANEIQEQYTAFALGPFFLNLKEA